MARRKRILDDGDDSDSSVGSDNDDINDFNPNEDPDIRAERELFEKPYGHKRRRGNGKDDATYGVFAEDSEEEGFGGRKKQNERKRSDWTKAPAFISGEKKVDISKTINVEKDSETSGSDDDSQIQSARDEDEDEDEDEEMGEDTTDGEPPASVPKSTPSRDQMDEDERTDEERPRLGGIGTRGLGSEKVATSSSSTGGLGFAAAAGIGMGKGGIGSNRGGLGSSTRGEASANGGASSGLPTAFGASSRPQRSFVRSGSGSGSNTPARAATPLSAAEATHFSKLSGTFGARMLSKMGWSAGTGLGTEGQGIVTPVESKLRPKGMGIAFKGFKEKTEQSKAEARRRGEVVSDDDDEKKKRGKGKGKGKVQEKREEVWKKPKKTKTKTEHKTYEEILAEAGSEAPAPGLGKIIDATGATLREVDSIADVSIASWTPSSDPMRLPEVRHNLRLITEACKTDLDGLAKEAKTIADRKKWVHSEDPKLRRKVESEAELISRLQAVHLVVDDINAKVKEAASSDYEPTLDTFSTLVEKLLSDFSSEYDHYHLDEIVVAAVAPTFRRMMASWEPAQDPTSFTGILRKWRTALKMVHNDPEADMQVDAYGSRSVSTRTLQIDRPMTPYESLLWNVWLPRVRSFINNEWTATNPAAAVKLYESWSDILPAFIRDNLLDQLILPKVASAVSNWNAKRSNVSLQAIVFPWLPHVGLRMDAYMDEARRKIKSMLRSWSATDGLPKDFLPWKEVFKANEWEDMLLKYVVPKLGALLRDEFRVNPRAQDLAPLQRVLEWAPPLLRPTIMGKLLDTEFFPKWLDVLHIWLIQPKTNFEEIAQWYTSWKGVFPENVVRIPEVERGFTNGLQLINRALELGPDAPTKLPKPDYKGKPDGTANQSTTKQPKQRPSRTHEITFRSIVEEHVATHNLLFMPAGKVHPKSRLPLFRVSRNIDKGGLLVYLLDDAVWAPDLEEGGDGDFRAVGLEELVVRATKL